MKIGYARKSTHLQDVAHQVDELTKAGCEQIGTVANRRWCYIYNPLLLMELHMNPFKGRHFQRDIILWAVRWY
ncbi:hypothetical protein AAER73_26595, partial [Klebsiella pneumoniae]